MEANQHYLGFLENLFYMEYQATLNLYSSQNIEVIGFHEGTVANLYDEYDDITVTSTTDSRDQELNFSEYDPLEFEDEGYFSGDTEVTEELSSLLFL